MINEKPDFKLENGENPNSQIAENEKAKSLN